MKAPDRKRGLYSGWSVPVAAVLCTAILAGPDAAGQELTALVAEAKGKVAYNKSGTSKYPPVQVGVTRLASGDIIFTGPNSTAILKIEGKTVDAGPEGFTQTTIEIGPKTKLMMLELFADLGDGSESVQVGLAQGQIISNVRRIDPNAERFEVQTPTAVAAVRGTKFGSGVEWTTPTRPEVNFKVISGQVAVLNLTRNPLAQLNAGQTADIAPSGNVTTGAIGGGAQGVGAGNPGQGAPLGGRAGGASGVTGGGAGETSDTIGGPMVDPDNEGDDVGGGPR